MDKMRNDESGKSESIQDRLDDLRTRERDSFSTISTFFWQVGQRPETPVSHGSRHDLYRKKKFQMLEWKMTIYDTREIRVHNPKVSAALIPPRRSRIQHFVDLDLISHRPREGEVGVEVEVE